MDMVAATKEWQDYFHKANDIFELSDPTSFEKLLTETGFKKELLQTLQTQEIFGTKQIFFDWIRPWVQAMQKKSSPLPQSILDAFSEAVLEKYTEWHPKNALGYITLEDTEIEIIAQKPIE